MQVSFLLFANGETICVPATTNMYAPDPITYYPIHSCKSLSLDICIHFRRNNIEIEMMDVKKAGVGSTAISS